MEKLYSDNVFHKYVHSWSLFFKDPEDERKFGQTTIMNMHLPPAIMAMTCCGLAFHALYRIVALISACLEHAIIVHTTPAKEATLLGVLLLSFVIEILLRITHRFEFAQGFFVYTVLPAVSVTAAFYTQQSPYFGAA